VSAPGLLGRLKRSIASQLPSRDELAKSRWLGPIAQQVLARELWHAQHEAVARGVAIGLFWAFTLPVAQIAVAAAHCVWWRGNIPVAVGVTLITNPFTIGFWLYLAYQVGSLVLDAPPPVRPVEGAGMVDWLQGVGWPAVLGMGLFAVVGSVAGYLLVKLVWRLRVNWKRRQRNRSGSSRPGR
jgi:uncharacterized protein